MTTERAWYLSFADDDGWLGYAIVEAEDFVGAVYEVMHRGINPGGEIKGFPLHDTIRTESRFKAELNRFIPKAEAGPVERIPE